MQAMCVLLWWCTPARAGLAEQAAVQSLRSGLGSQAVIVTDPTSGAASALRGLTAPLADGRAHPGEAAVAWMQAHGEAFGLRRGVDDLRLRRVEARRAGRSRITIDQYYAGLPVVGASSRALVDAEGALIGLSSGVRAGIALDPVPAVSEAAAVARVATALGALLSEQPGQARLAIRVADDGDRLAYEVTIMARDGRPTRSWVDATDGAPIVLDAGVANAAGLVYEIDPLGPLVSHPLPGLGGLTTLASGLLRVEDSVNSPAVADGQGDFPYPPADVHFDQVNAYYHASHFLQDFLVGHLGATPLSESLLVRVQFRTDPFVAFTSGRFVYLGQPIVGFVHEVARATDLVVHETTHAVLYDNDVQPTGLRREAGALHEALADYFAAAVTNDPGIGEWLYIPFPRGATRVDQPLPFWNYANYDQAGFAGGDAASPWGNGMILSATLWDLRQRIGDSADSLVVEAIDLLPSSPMWGQLANAMLVSDLTLHGGRFQSEIANAFIRRGVRGAIEASIAVVGPNTLPPGQEGTFTTSACCGGLTGRYEWRARFWCRGEPCGDAVAVGSGPTLTLALDNDVELRVQVIGPWGDTLLSAPHFVGVRVPELTVFGPLRAPVGMAAEWSARISAVGPARVDWTRRYRTNNGAVVENLGTHDALRFAPSGPFELTARLLDGLGRVTTRVIQVETFTPAVVPERLLELAAVTRWDAGARIAQTRFELPSSGMLDARVYDVRGQERAVVAVGALPAGAHVVQWDLSPLESGVYFMHVRLAGVPDMTRRLVIVR